MPNPAIVPAPPGLGGPPAAPVAAPPPPPGAPEDAPAGAAPLERPVHHDMASSSGSGISELADVVMKLEDLENRFHALDQTVQELTGLVMDLQTSLATVLENNLRGRRSPPPP